MDFQLLMLARRIANTFTTRRTKSASNPLFFPRILGKESGLARLYKIGCPGGSNPLRKLPRPRPGPILLWHRAKG